MSTTTVRWIGGKQFIGIDSTSHSVVLSSPAENVGIKPSDLLLIAVASGLAMDMVEILVKRHMLVSGLTITSSGEQDQDPPWTFRKIHLHFQLCGRNLTDTAVAQAIEMAEEKYCSIAATIRATAELTKDFEIFNEE